MICTCPTCGDKFEHNPYGGMAELEASPLRESIHEPWMRCPACHEPIVFFSKASDPASWDYNPAT
jgi:ribosomal protein S27E